MTSRTERQSSEAYSSGSVVGVLQRWYHVPVLAVLMVFMLATRVQRQSYERFVRPDGTIRFAGIDPWYHWRTTMYSVENWPRTMPFDAYTNFPYGSSVGQFGTAFDQLIATVALIVGLGDPSEGTVALVFVLTPPVMGALVAIPTYYIGKRLGGRIGGLTGVALLALFPGTFFYRSSIGFTDHHVAEVLFMSLALLATMVALTAAEREKPVYELLVERELVALRRPVGYSVLAGVAIALYIWNWPAGVVLLGIFGAYFLLKLTAEYVRGESPEHVAFVGAVSMAVVGVLTLATIERFDTGATTYGIMQPFLAFTVAGGCVFMAWLARQWDDRRLERLYYPATVGGILAVGILVLAVFLPDLFDTIYTNVERRMLFGQHATDLTISEAQPVEDVRAHVFREYGLAFYTAIAGLLVLLVRPLLDGEHSAERFLIVVWALFITAMAFTQVRFNYYYAVTIAVLNAYAVGQVVEFADVGTPTSLGKLRDVKGYQVMAFVVVVMLLFVPLMPAFADTTVVERGQNLGPNGDAVKWEPANEWLADHSPVPGTYGGAENPMDPYGTYAVPDGAFDYPEGAYGVMSWWDYGHVITTQAERIPHANPFQQGARSSSAFLLTQTETRANLLLDALPVTSAPQRLDDDELRAIVDDRTDQQANEEIRYVMIDDSMAAGKFSAIATWTGPGFGPHIDFEPVEIAENESAELPVRGERYADTTLSRLYFDDASGMETYRLVHETERSTVIGSIARLGQDDTWQPFELNQELSFQVINAVQQLPDYALYDVRQAAAVKTYERVEGAQLVGETTAPEGTEVTVSLALNATTSERSFVYSQVATVAADGTFTLTVPYATANDLGPAEGYTDTSVLAEGEYDVVVGDGDEPTATGTVAVPERAIYDGETVTIELEPAE